MTKELQSGRQISRFERAFNINCGASGQGCVSRMDFYKFK